MKAAGFARWSVDGITRKANSIARSLRLIGSWARPVSHSFTRSRLLTDSSAEVPPAMGRSERGLDDVAAHGGSPHPRHRCWREIIVGLQITCCWKDWDDQRLQRCLVPRLYEYADFRRVGGIRSTDNDYSTRLRRRARLTRVDTGNEQSGRPLSG